MLDDAERLDAEVLATVEGLEARLDAGDLDAYFAGFAPDATFLFYNEERRLESTAEYRALLEERIAGSGLRFLDRLRSEVRVQRWEDVAVVTFLDEATYEWEGDRETTRGRASWVLRRDGERWVVIHVHISPAAAPPG
ncbi:MAG TPA: nuclear transport factor 2 family protein [Actinomycetota bacterium]|nr:nuclear transport factor 2 family protein [Actinomycetota bacterium]